MFYWQSVYLAVANIKLFLFTGFEVFGLVYIRNDFVMVTELYNYVVNIAIIVLLDTTNR